VPNRNPFSRALIRPSIRLISLYLSFRTQLHSSKPSPQRCNWLVLAAIFVAFVLLASAGGTYAQSAAFATIAGRALDPKGASIPNAKVTATNTETGITRTTETTNDGLDRFENLAPGCEIRWVLRWKR
jgi:hypothetical protein